MKIVVAVILVAASWTPVMADVGPPLIQTCQSTRMSITMYVGINRALVHETASVFVPAGAGDVRFHWTDASIEGPVELCGPDDVRIGGLRHPVGESKTYSWPVAALEAGARDFTVSYFLKGLKWSASYWLTFDAHAGTASLLGKLHLTNDSKLPLRGAHVRLCIAPTGALGKLDAAEGIAPPQQYADLEEFHLEPGWQRRVEFIRLGDIPARIVHRADPSAHKQEVRKYLLVDLKSAPTPGALPKGHMEVFEVSEGRRAPVIGADLNHATDKETEVYLGIERDIVFERKQMSRRKTDITFDRLGRVTGHKTIEETLDTFRNRLPVAVQIELTERVSGKWSFAGKTPPTKKDAGCVRWDFELPPDQRKEIRFTITRTTG